MHIKNKKTCTEQNINNQSLTQVSELYVHISFCFKVFRSLQNLLTGGHGHVMCMPDLIPFSLIPMQQFSGTDGTSCVVSQD